MFERMSENNAREAMSAMLEHFTPRHLRRMLEAAIAEQNGDPLAALEAGTILEEHKDSDPPTPAQAEFLAALKQQEVRLKIWG